MTPARAARAALPVLALLLAGCGDSDPGLAEDPAASGSPSQEPTSEPTSEPTEDPDGFGPTDYSYTLTLTCYCPDAGVPIRVTVADDEVVSAVYARSGGRGGAQAGEDVPLARVLTIDEVIEAADDPDAHRVEVDWPEDQDYPSSVAIDRSEQVVDEEIGYRLRDVEVAEPAS
ncbi:hypothetical protein NOK12_21590 [Nocardioides sp. OK12]|uniref:DUF6174 domain-containing protein n=1 Tax=Nocardioides TaxID=1839 RepID=UPI0021C264ED|nr:DUF6174 domain-containing protein [Nocardioides sp. OK12]GHJ59641.1 hypothetical protein NOK12_21590 [Nocardioides sp. OK12]